MLAQLWTFGQHGTASPPVEILPQGFSHELRHIPALLDKLTFVALQYLMYKIFDIKLVHYSKRHHPCPNPCCENHYPLKKKVLSCFTYSIST